MFKIKNKENKKFIVQYLNEGRSWDFSEHVLEDYKHYASFEYELEKVPSERRPALISQMISGYALQYPMKKILEKFDVEKTMESEQVIPKSLEYHFDKLILEVTREKIGYTMNDEKAHFNKKTFAETVLKICRLTINRKDPETLMVYNTYSGFWEDATIPLKRLILELAHFAGGDALDTWNSYLEKSIMDILVRKTRLMEPQRFNQRYFPFANVALDSTTGEVVTHSPRHLATFGSPVNFNPHAAYPVFDHFLKGIFEEESTIQFVQEFFGYVLSNSHKGNMLLLGNGRGANGKSTLFDVLAQLLGVANVSSAPLANFNTDFGLEPLLGMKLNLATESDADAFKTGKLKALTAGEAISVNRKNKTEITVVLPTKLVFLVNELPMLSDGSTGFERRLIILPFNKTFTPDKQDKDLPKKLITELEGILNWSLEGLRRLIANNYRFTQSTTMKEAKEAYFGAGNPVDRFVKDFVIPRPGHILESKEVLQAYRTWMMKKNYPYKGTDSAQVFWNEFDLAARKKTIEYKKSKSNGKTVVRDIVISTGES